MDTLFIVMPAYNEEKNIEKTVRDWYPVIEKYNNNNSSRLVIVNDGSRDNTLEKGKELMKLYPLLEVVDKPNSGHGASVIFAYRYAINHGADYVFQTDSDGQTNPEEFVQFWDHRKGYDAIIGVRTKRGDGEARAFVEKVVCMLVRLFFGVTVKDANAPFRLMRADILEKYLDKMPSDYNLPNIMLTTYYAYYNNELLFLPISFKPRQAGKNSINIKRIISIGWKALGDFYQFRKAMKGN